MRKIILIFLYLTATNSTTISSKVDIIKTFYKNQDTEELLSSIITEEQAIRVVDNIMDDVVEDEELDHEGAMNMLCEHNYINEELLDFAINYLESRYKIYLLAQTANKMFIEIVNKKTNYLDIVSTIMGIAPNNNDANYLITALRIKIFSNILSKINLYIERINFQKIENNIDIENIFLEIKKIIEILLIAVVQKIITIKTAMNLISKSDLDSDKKQYAKTMLNLKYIMTIHSNTLRKKETII